MNASELAKKWIRPPLIPAFRAYVRYAPVALGKPFVWNALSHLFQFADHRFKARTVFGMDISGNTIDHIQRRIYYFGVWEPNLTAFLMRRLCPGDLFVDVGANIGYFSLLAAKFVGTSGKVLAIEASPSIFEKLANNLRYNNLDNVVALNLAASDSSGVTSVYLGPEVNIGQTTVLKTDHYRVECEIQCKRLDDILSSEDLQRAKIIKIDVEGAEWAVMAGVLPLLKSFPETLEVVIEISPRRLETLGKSAEEILRMFEMTGFNAYELENDYSDASYLSSLSGKRPTRLRESIEQRAAVDLVFSKKDRDVL
jgi:FkbM family methyltransferase